MIKLGWMTDDACVIGDTDPKRNVARFPLLPDALTQVILNQIYDEGAYAGGSYMASLSIPEAQTDVFTRNSKLEGLNADHVVQIADHRRLIGQFWSDERSLEECVPRGDRSRFYASVAENDFMIYFYINCGVD